MSPLAGCFWLALSKKLALFQVAMLQPDVSDTGKTVHNAEVTDV